MNSGPERLNERLVSQLHFEAVTRLRIEERARRFLQWLSVALLLAIILASLLPYDFNSQSFAEGWQQFLNAPAIDPHYWYNDQWTGHAIAYGTLAFCIVGASLRRTGIMAAVNAGLFAFVICVGFTCLLEFGQTFMLTRNVSGNDISAGVIGAIVGIIAWLIVGPSLLSFGARVERGGIDALTAGAALYSIAYAFLCFFPFDIIFSFHGLSEMAQSGKQILGSSVDDQGFVRSKARIFLEMILAIPVGVLLVRRSPAFGIVCAILLGFGAEIIQFALVTGQSTYMGGLSRSAGFVLGFIGARWFLGQRGIPEIGTPYMVVLKVLAALAILPYIALVVLLDRWGTGSRPSPDEIQTILVELRWIPFYYMYSVDEVVAAVSAMSQMILYAPLGGILWFLYGRRSALAYVTAFLLAGVISGFVEAGGLYMAGHRPDPTNSLLSVIGACGGLWFAGATRHWAGKVLSETHGVPEPLSGSFRWSVSALVGIVLLVAAVWLILDYPAGNGWLIAGLVAYALLLRSHPNAWLVLVPALLPVLDTTVLTGRVLVEPFDILILATIGMELIREPLRLRDFGWRGAFLWVMLAYVAAYMIAVLNGLLPLPPSDANAFTSPFSPWMTVWVAKGFFGILALAPLMWRAFRDHPGAILLLAYGMAAGLLLCGLVVVWERFLFPGIFDFTTEYRANAAFSTMRTGGASLDSYLATTLPFALIIFFLHRNWKGAVAAAFLILIGLYAVYGTFSRGPFIAVLCAAAVLGVGLLVASRKTAGGLIRLGVIVVAGAALVGAATIPFVGGSFLAKRFETTAEDKGIRFDHWTRSLEMRERDGLSLLFGTGPGRFPAHYFAKNDDPRPMASMILGDEGDMRFIRMSAGQRMYLSQFVRVKPDRTYKLSFQVRGHGINPALSIPICEKWITDSFACEHVIIPAAEGEWQHVEVKVSSVKLASGQGSFGWITSRPVKFTIFNDIDNTVLDVTDLRLETDRGRNLLDNGDFKQGLDFWYITVDDHLPWHIKNMFVAALFDQGYAGLLLLVGILAVTGYRLTRQIVAGDRYSAVLAAALTGFLVVGVIDSPFDAPRMAILFFLIIFTGYYLGRLQETGKQETDK